MVRCPYKSVCKSYPLKCSICARNEEQDFFIPKQQQHPYWVIKPFRESV